MYIIALNRLLTVWEFLYHKKMWKITIIRSEDFCRCICARSLSQAFTHIADVEIISQMDPPAHISVSKCFHAHHTDCRHLGSRFRQQFATLSPNCVSHAAHDKTSFLYCPQKRFFSILFSKGVCRKSGSRGHPNKMSPGPGPVTLH